MTAYQQISDATIEVASSEDALFDPSQCATTANQGLKGIAVETRILAPRLSSLIPPPFTS